MKHLKIGMLTLFTALLFAFTSNAQVQLVSDGNSKTTDTITNAGTESFTTPANTINSGVEGKYRLHFDATNISGTSTFKVVIHSRAYAGGSAGYSLHHKNAGTDGVNCDTLQVTAGVPGSYDFNLVPLGQSNATANNKSNAGRAVGFKVYFIGAGTQSTQIKNVAIITQK